MSSEWELHCNNVQCRRALSTKAAVTTCSHIFCMECSQCFNRALVCPACETSLTETDDIIFQELNPLEEYKSSVLAGLRPDILMECATRALSFWSYQMTQETCFQEMMYKQLDEKYTSLERQVQAIVREANHEITGLREKVSNLQKDLELEKHRNHELSENFADKGKQLQKLQQMYEKSRRRALVQSTQATSNGNNNAMNDMMDFQPDDPLGGAPFQQAVAPPPTSAPPGIPPPAHTVHHHSRPPMTTAAGRRVTYNNGGGPFQVRHPQQQQTSGIRMMPSNPNAGANGNGGPLGVFHGRSPTAINNNLNAQFNNNGHHLSHNAAGNGNGNTFQNSRRVASLPLHVGRPGRQPQWSPSMG
ncbi:hypothetical protein SeMB42_g00705 [Synchytrium endobioticum]|uniref:RING-type domain-containing protein n=1 Tax=Synchytrium endobioticum TaxID=286115 RepID=A0A507DJ68_9FUNG|nr:hypothetical protein SeLEV6574_g00252 [Synchytrium endobioticum]TPX53546.1 hypothetical protein SeMB42_g00705 [Synchytrium endobioticum]